ncbi:hypothetical protein G6F40_014363 [Rhizopus arrhizus]|nr:hypothetical protein G6F40_014363 [Rhizopus arrhizus]
MRRTGVARRPEIQARRIGFGVSHELAERRRRQARPHRQHIGRPRHHAHRRELDRVIAELAVEQRVHHMRADRAHEDRIAIGRRGGRHLRGDHPTRTGAVFDHDALAPHVSPALAPRARPDIGDAPGPKRHHQPNGPLRKPRVRACPHSRRQRQRGHLAQNLHAIPLDWAVSALMTRSVL